MRASVLTQHNNNQRTGVNPAEPDLTPDAVRKRFRWLRTLRVDPPEEGGLVASQIVAQPLLAADVDFGGGVKKDVLIVATMHGTVYAFDATHNGDPNHAYPRLWAVWLGPVVQNLPGHDEKDIWGTNPEWGVLSTPVIDPKRGVVYAVVWNPDGGGLHRLHALDLKSGNPVVARQEIRGSAAGPHGDVHFDPVFQKQRPGLLLVRPEDVPEAHRADVGPEGTLYVAFGASAEGMLINNRPTFNGWVFAFDAKTLQIRGRPWCSTPKEGRGGVWQAGQGPVATPDGDVVVMTGDGHADGQTDFGQSIVRLSGKDLRLLDYFTPHDWQQQVPPHGDDDLGASGPVYVTSGPFVIGGGKTGVLYCLDANHLGEGDTGDPNHPDHVLGKIQATADPPGWAIHPPPPGWDKDHHIHGSPVYFAPLKRLYVWGENDVLRSFTLDDHGKFHTPDPQIGDVIAASGMPGGMLSLTSDGDKHPVLWALMPAPAPFSPGNPDRANANKTIHVKGVLRAFDATTLQEVWNSDAPGVGGVPWDFAKFSPPTVANGRAYVPTYDGMLFVYGAR
jgi:outer membrane protein assembly factor BamB